ncbi:hypothetical protein [Streptomyces sp. RTd22]|uniref:hypothetical protein n=1 Tax=Streptomyces sp. RTd22 TaxID=1841249 RepID=UPI002D21B658|nr:hypothetical protein [Streptomyces sp. RTd22]
MASSATPHGRADAARWGVGASGPVPMVGTADRGAPAPGRRGVPAPGADDRGHSPAALAAPATTGTTATSVTAPTSGSGRSPPSAWPAAPLPAHSSHEPPTSPRR